MMLCPFFSVVMAVQNGMAFLPESIEGILNQTFTDFEFITVDDHSTDGTIDYLRSLTDPRVRVLSSDGHGQTHALNVGIRASRAEWIVRMDGDDYCDPRRLELQKQTIVQAPHRPVIVTSDYVVCDESLSPVAEIRLAPPNARLRHYIEKRNNPFCHPTVTFHRATAVDVGLYDTRIRNGQDYHLWLRMLTRGDWAHLPMPLVKYRVRKGSLSVLYQPEQERERQAILEGVPPPVGEERRSGSDAEIDAVYHYKLGFSAWVGGRRGPMIRHLTRSIWSGGAMRANALVLIGLGLVFPRRLYLTLARYRGVFA